MREPLDAGASTALAIGLAVALGSLGALRHDDARPHRELAGVDHVLEKAERERVLGVPRGVEKREGEK